METFSRPDQEAAVLATVLKYPDSASIATQWLGNLWKDAFVSSTEHTQIAAAVRELVDTGKLPDFRAVQLHLETLQREAALTYLSELMRHVEHQDFLEQRCIELNSTTQIRLYGTIANDIQADIARGITDVNAFSEQIQKRLIDTSSGGLAIKNAVQATGLIWERYTNKKANPTALTGIPTGFASIDQETMGLPFGSMAVLAARPRHGKSAISGNVTLTAIKAGYPVFVISHEMTAEEYVERMACSLAGVDYQNLKSGRLNTKTEARLIEALNWIDRARLAFIDESDASPRQCAAAVINWTNRHGPGLVIVDYLQLERLPNCSKPRHEEIGEISWLWRGTFKKTKCAGLVLSQLKRDADGRAPKLSDLKDSGSIEQDAAIVLLLYRESLENPKKPANEAYLMMAKHRNGNLACGHLHFTGHSMTFRDWDDDADKTLMTDEMRAAEARAIETQTGS